MTTAIAHMELNNFSTALTNVIGLFSPERYSLEDKLFRTLDKKCDKLQELTIDLINIMNKEPYENVLPLESLRFFRPVIDLMKDGSLMPKSEKDNEIIRKYSSTLNKFYRVIHLLSDFIEALDQYFDDEGKDKIAYYLQLIHEYRSDRIENLKLAKEFVYTDLEEWE